MRNVAAITTICGIISDISVDSQYSVRMKDPTHKYITCADISVIICTVFLGVLTTPFKLKDFWHILYSLTQIDATLLLTEDPPAPAVRRNDRKSSILLIATALILFSMLIVGDIALWERTAHASHADQFFLRNYFAFYILYYIVLLQEIYYWHLVDFIKRRIQSLNCELGTSIEQQYRNSNAYSNNNKWISVLANNNASSDYQFVAKQQRASSDLLTIKRVSQLIRVHEYICEAIEAVNNWCGISVLVITFLV